LPPDSSTDSIPTRDWDAIAHDYAASPLTVPDLCALHHISRAGLYNRANRDGWVKRSVLRRATPLQLTPPHRLRGKRRLARRMMTALGHKMTEFETRMAHAAASAAQPSAADSERDARTLGTLVRLFDKLKGIGTMASAKTGAARSSRTAGKDIHDADRFRNDLARRLERLRDSIGG
jgi:hypothetical protein